MPIPHDCTRQTEVVSYFEKQTAARNSGWFLDFLFSDARTDAEKLEVRDYTDSDHAPLFYTNPCGLPNIVKGVDEAVSLREFTWPVIKAEAQITGCDVDEQRIAAKKEGSFEPGDVVPVGMQRYQKAFMKEMGGVLGSLRATHIAEAISLLKTGGYVLSDSANTNVGTVDFGRSADLTNIDVSTTSQDFCEPCARPDQFFEAIGREMSRCGAVAGVMDVIHSQTSWNAYEAHTQREAIKFENVPPAEFIATERTPFLSYNDVQFKGTSNGGTIRHWVTNAQFVDVDGQTKPVLDEGELLMVNQGGFSARRIYRTVTSDNKEMLPAGANPFFVYDDLDREYNRKARKYSPWIEEYHLMVPSNVNGAVLARVTGPDCEPCVTCM